MLRTTRSAHPLTIQPYALQGFSYDPPPYGGLAFCLFRDSTAQQVHDRFCEQVLSAVGHRWLPVYRMADGEFIFMVGERGLPPGGWREQLRSLPRRVRDRVLHRTATCWGETYSGHEKEVAAARFQHSVQQIAEAGYLAIYFVARKDGWARSYGMPVWRWLDQHDITLKSSNYVPFYSVYALLTGPRRKELLGGRRILVVTHTTREREQRMRAGLQQDGAQSVEFLEISSTKALLDDVDLASIRTQPDLALVAAGIGAANILTQLQGLRVPCIDSGIALECYVDPGRRFERPFLIGDDRIEPAELTALRKF